MGPIPPPRRPARLGSRTSRTGPSKLNSSARSDLVGRMPQGPTPRCPVPIDLDGCAVGRGRRRQLLRKEVIQPQVPLRLPCYDFTPVTSHTMDGCPPCGLDHLLPVQLAPMV